MTRLYLLGLGSNLGDRRRHLRRAVEFLRGLGRVTALSPLYQTEPQGMPGAEDFLNLAAALETDMEPQALLAAVKEQERRQGRSPGEPMRPRPIDVDILLAGGLVLSSPALTIPHPRLAQRRFVLAPLADIAPRALHPALGKTVAELLAALGEGQRVARAGGLEE